MSECQERSEGRIGNAVELLDAAVGYFGPIRLGRTTRYALRPAPAGPVKSGSVATMR